MAAESFSNQLIDEHGHFNGHRIEAFKKALNLADCGLSYAVVSIMGPQSSGKSTLLNHLFGTKFAELDAEKSRSQTTRGIWLARGVDIDPCIIVLDLEGSDGRERGEDDTKFEKQSALFALAVSDILLINLCNKDIGREQASGKPLLKTILQGMTRLSEPRKTTLRFVIRDISKTPIEVLEGTIRQDIHMIWDSLQKPEAYRETRLDELLKIEFIALSNYEYQEEQFKEQVASLRLKLAAGLAGHRRAIPAAQFFYSAQEIWKVIEKNKDLYLPTHKVMVATVRCEEIVNGKSAGFSSDEEWRQLKEAVQHGLVPHFGQKLRLLLDKYLSGYDREAQYFDDGVKVAKRTQLESNILQLAYPAYESVLSRLRSKTLDDFKEFFHEALKRGGGFAVTVRNCTQKFMSVFDARHKEAVVERTKWDCLEVHEKIRRDIDAHVASVRAEKLSEFKTKYEVQLNKALVKSMEALLDTNLVALLDTNHADIWPEIRKLLKLETGSALSRLDSALCAFDIDHTTTNKLKDWLERCARDTVESKMREEAASILRRMKEIFERSFTKYPSGTPRKWKVKENIAQITTDARSTALKFLSVIAAIRMDDNIDNIFNTLSLALLSVTDNGTQSDVILASSSWEKVPLERMLITPVECESLWRRFIAETDVSVTQANETQEKRRWKRRIRQAKLAAATVTLAASVVTGGVAGVAVTAGVAGATTVASIAGAAGAASLASVARNARD